MHAARMYLFSVLAFAVTAATALAQVGRLENATCHGTAIQFMDSPQEAAKQAAKEKKLVFVLHVSGYFEDPNFT